MTPPQELTIKQTVSRAKKAIKRGKTDVAIRLYNTVLQHDPNHPVAIKGLRKLQKELPVNQSVQDQILNPPQEKINALFELFDAGLMEETEQACRELLQTYPKSLIVLNIFGIALQNQSKLRGAVQVFDTAIELKPDYADAYNNRANALRDLGEAEESFKSCEKAIELNPNFSLAFNNRGNALFDLGRLDDALVSFDKAIELESDCVEAHYGRADALSSLGLLEEALKSYQKVIELKPDYVKAYLGSAVTLKNLGHFNEALAGYAKAIEIKPGYAEAYCNRAFILRDLGMFSDALSDFEKAIAARPEYVLAHHGIGILKTYRSGDPQIEIMEGVYADVKTRDADRVHLCFAMAKAYEDLGEYERSFRFLKEGNQLRHKELDYQIDEDRKEISTVKDIFTAGGLPLDVSIERKSPIQQIFIVGMPRSGTTLVEQIICSHSTVYGAGELVIMEELINSFLPDISDKNTSEKNRQLAQNKINAVRDGYLEGLRSLGVSEGIITDKMPLNFRWIGFILSAFPEAKIINLNRDARATCWSMYKRYFTTTAHGYAYDLASLAEYFSLYTELMDFWRERYPASIYDIGYENLTENQEEETRKLLAFCDLEWEDGCVDFHTTKRLVDTASATQVRKTMYKESSEAWRSYEKYLQPLISALG